MHSRTGTALAGSGAIGAVLEVSGTPTSLLVSRDKIVMLYVIHEHATGARDDGGSPA